MSINLSNVNITIQQFQEIASGKYNAGEVKLTSETSLGKINNHVGYGGTNNDTISHDEVLAIKDAFVRALSKSGVGVNALAEIRRRIGLAPDPLSPKALVERSIRPLSRQQIRSILDEHRDEINLATGAQTVRTHAEIYARHGDEAIARYERTRRAVNIAFMQSRNLDGNRRILDLQRVIAGDIHFCTGEDRTRLISSAEMLRAEILRLAGNGALSEDPNSTITVRKGDGSTVTLGLGMSKRDFIDKLDDRLLQLRSDRQAPQSTIDAHNEYRLAKAGGAEGKANWLASLQDNPLGGFKARAVAVGMLVEFGILDNASLALLNKVSDQDAITFVSFLMTNPDSLKGQQLRDSAAFQHLVQQAAANAQVPQNRQAYIPVPSPEEFNQELNDKLRGNLDRAPLRFKRMVDEMRSELTAAFGAEAVPANMRIGDMGVSNQLYTALAGDNNRLQDYATPEALKARLMPEARKECAKRFFAAALTPMLKLYGLPEVVATAVTNNLFNRHPEICERLLQARNPTEASAIVGGFKNEIDEAMRRKAAVDSCKANVQGWAREEMARQMGIPVASLEGMGVNFNQLVAKASRLASKICDGEDAANTDAEIETKFRAMARAAATERATLLAQADGLEGVSPQTRDEIKRQLMMIDVVTGLDLAAIKAALGDVHAGDLMPALEDGSARNDALNMLGTVGQRVKGAAAAYINANNGTPELLQAVTKIMLAIAVCDQPGLVDRLDQFMNRPEMFGVNLADLTRIDGLPDIALHADIFMTIVPEEGFSADSAAIAGGIATGRLPPLAAQAINRAFADLGLANLSAEAKTAMLAGAAGQALAAQVRALRIPCTPTVLRGLARMHFANAAAVEAAKRYAAVLGQTHGLEVDADSARRTQEALFARFPDLAGKVATAMSNAAARGENARIAANNVLKDYTKEIEIAIRAFRDVTLADAGALETAAARIADRTGLDENTVRSRLDLGALSFAGGGVFANLRDGIGRDLANPNVPLERPEDYDLAGIRERCNQELERFIEQKAGVIAAIDTLGAGDAVKGELVSQALAKRDWNDPEIVNTARQILSGPAMQAQIAVLGSVLKPENLANLPNEDVLRAVERFAAAVNGAIGNANPHAAIVRDIIVHAVVGQLGETFATTMEKLVATGRFDQIDRMAAGKAGDDAVYAKRFIGIAYANLANEWTTDDIAGRFGAGDPDRELKARVKAAVTKGPELFAKYSVGLEEAQKAILKAFIATLDLRTDTLSASEWAIRMKLVEFRIAGEGFTTEGSAARAEALALGYAPGELARLQQVADFYRQATNCTDVEAYMAAINPKSDARRLFAFGGRFVSSAENFAAGLRLQREFKAWFAETAALVQQHRNQPQDGGSITVIHADPLLFKPEAAIAFEKFLFEEIALNEALPLDAENPRAVFEMEANPATRFIGRGYTNGCIATVAQIPPEKRSFMYKVFDLIAPLGANRVQAQVRGLGLNDSVELIARIFRNYDQIAEMDRTGTLTRESFFARFYPDVPGAGKMTNHEIIRASTNIVQTAFRTNPAKIVAGSSYVTDCGLTATEAVEAVNSGKIVQRAPYVAAGTVSISEFGTPAGARSQAVLDLLRPSFPTFGQAELPAVTEAGKSFKAVFPDTTTLTSANNAQANVIAEKLAEFCGDAHLAQLESVYLAFTQGAEGPVCGAFMDLGIHTNEHMPLTYTLSKNAETGVITIRYSEPEGFPVKFSWEATIDTDGKVATTPMTAKVESIPVGLARNVAAVAARRMGKQLGEAQLGRAAELIAQHCVEMNVKNAGLFANFIVQLPLDGDEKDIQRAVSMANSIRQWRDIDIVDPTIAEVEAVVKDEAIDDLASYMGPNYAGQFEDPNPTLYRAFVVDVNRATVVIGDKVHEVSRTNVPQALAEFKQALDGKPNSQKAISSLMHQGSAMRTMRLQIKQDAAPTARRPQPQSSCRQPGAEKFVNRTGNPALFQVPMIVEDPTSRYELQLSDDGNTATVRLVWSGKINVGVTLKENLDTFGKIDVTEEITLDLTGDNPRITDLHLGQKISA